MPGASPEVAAHAAAAPLVDQEYLREDDQAEDREEHDDEHEGHVGALLEDARVAPAPAGSGASRTHPSDTLKSTQTHAPRWISIYFTPPGMRMDYSGAIIVCDVYRGCRCNNLFV